MENIRLDDFLRDLSINAMNSNTQSKSEIMVLQN